MKVEIEYEGITGYGEASMPPYLGQSVESVTAFLQKVNLEQFCDPFMLEDILEYVDGLSEGDSASKAAAWSCLLTLVSALLLSRIQIFIFLFCWQKTSSLFARMINCSIFALRKSS